jgi:Effector Associated Constant Component 1
LSEANVIRLQVAGDEDADAERVAELASRLREELLELVDHPRAAPPPPGAKGAALEWASLAVTFAGAVPGMLSVMQGWLGRHRGCSITLSAEGDTLTLDDLSRTDRDRMAHAWLRKHGLE